MSPRLRFVSFVSGSALKRCAGAARVFGRMRDLFTQTSFPVRSKVREFNKSLSHRHKHYLPPTECLLTGVRHRLVLCKRLLLTRTGHDAARCHAAIRLRRPAIWSASRAASSPTPDKNEEVILDNHCRPIKYMPGTSVMPCR